MRAFRHNSPPFPLISPPSNPSVSPPPPPSLCTPLPPLLLQPPRKPKSESNKQSSRTKHSLTSSYANGPHRLDWANQPNPFLLSQSPSLLLPLPHPNPSSSTPQSRYHLPLLLRLPRPLCLEIHLVPPRQPPPHRILPPLPFALLHPSACPLHTQHPFATMLYPNPQIPLSLPFLLPLPLLHHLARSMEVWQAHLPLLQPRRRPCHRCSRHGPSGLFSSILPPLLPTSSISILSESSSSARNDGPTSMSVTNLSPWQTTVGAGTIRMQLDRGSTAKQLHHRHRSRPRSHLLDGADVGVGSEEDVLELGFLLVDFFDGFLGGGVVGGGGLE